MTVLKIYTVVAFTINGEQIKRLNAVDEVDAIQKMGEICALNLDPTMTRVAVFGPDGRVTTNAKYETTIPQTHFRLQS